MTKNVLPWIVYVDFNIPQPHSLTKFPNSLYPQLQPFRLDNRRPRTTKGNDDFSCSTTFNPCCHFTPPRPSLPWPQ